MTVGHLVLIVIGIGWLVYTYYTVQTLRRKHDMEDDYAALNIIGNVALLIGSVVYLFLNYWNTVIF